LAGLVYFEPGKFSVVNGPRWKIPFLSLSLNNPSVLVNMKLYTPTLSVAARLSLCHYRNNEGALY
jgi:hypothetical protein